jgi:hypothetical protein
MPGQSTWSHGSGLAGSHQLHDGQIAHHSHAPVARRANPSQSASDPACVKTAFNDMILLRVAGGFDDALCRWR